MLSHFVRRWSDGIMQSNFLMRFMASLKARVYFVREEDYQHLTKHFPIFIPLSLSLFCKARRAQKLCAHSAACKILFPFVLLSE